MQATNLDQLVQILDRHERELQELRHFKDSYEEKLSKLSVYDQKLLTIASPLADLSLFKTSFEENQLSKLSGYD